MSQISVRRLDRDAEELPLVRGQGRASTLTGPRGAARERSLIYFDLASGGQSVDFRHPYEAVYYVVEGAGRVVDTDTGEAHAARGGVVIYLTADQGYRLEGPAVFVGGPCPPDPALFETLRDKGKD